LFRFLIIGENVNLAGKVFYRLALRPNQISFFALKQKTETKKFKTTALDDPFHFLIRKRMNSSDYHRNQTAFFFI